MPNGDLDRLISYVPPDPGPTKVGVVLTFPEGVTLEQVHSLISNLKIEPESTQIEEYDSGYGSPVFYIP
jgi:hypothetical protein